MIRKAMVLIFCAMCMVSVLAPPALAVDMILANQITVAWDAVPDAAAYRVYTKLPDGTMQRLEREITETQSVITFTDDAAVLVGVQSVRTVTLPGMTEPSEAVSIIAWSDQPQSCLNGLAFGAYFIRAPPAPGGLRGQ
jgi:hypothetical protein